ncbi:aspartate/glutamate racemase family protein [Motiliproteus sp. MSK22-1]|uniref:maleate cis-trans isomerase family protein n=1 Tax=Motiliproteus sp. MSK22-1 TaxID=1897630 RepID=UPI000976D6DB|nr:aspartate/glutamate racemase family protein [Motiliproteus sp. MSK22-1]OMH27143.1 Asp/Glu racemase [Motiliproteus sp. MSK22-1]
MKVSTIEPAQPLDHLAPAGRIGVVALATDFNIEQDLRRMLPGDTQIFTSRVRNYNPLTIENLRSMAPGISAAADTILPGTQLDAIIYGCTSGTVAIGSERIAELIHQSCPGVPVTNPVTAAVAAFRQLGARRISILTPYTEQVNCEVAELFQRHGFEVLNIAGFGFEDDTAMTFISPVDIVNAAKNVCDAQADLLFVSCTALRASVVLDEIEAQLGKPVVSSNQALTWHSLQLLGYPAPVSGYGSLLQQLPV